MLSNFLSTKCPEQQIHADSIRRLFRARRRELGGACQSRRLLAEEIQMP